VEVTSIRLILLCTKLTKLVSIYDVTGHWCCASVIIAWLKPAIRMGLFSARKCICPLCTQCYNLDAIAPREGSGPPEWPTSGRVSGVLRPNYCGMGVACLLLRMDAVADLEGAERAPPLLPLGRRTDAVTAWASAHRGKWGQLTHWKNG